MDKLLKKILKFRDERDWSQFHNPKDLAISLSLEAAELLEIFQWKNPEQVESLKKDSKYLKKVKEELGDIFIYALLISNEFGLDPLKLINEKIKINEKKYPKDKVKGKADKYTEY